MLGSPPASASQGLELQPCTTTVDLTGPFYDGELSQKSLQICPVWAQLSAQGLSYHGSSDRGLGRYSQ